MAEYEIQPLVAPGWALFVFTNLDLDIEDDDNEDDTRLYIGLDEARALAQPDGSMSPHNIIEAYVAEHKLMRAMLNGAVIYHNDMATTIMRRIDMWPLVWEWFKEAYRMHLVDQWQLVQG